MNDKTVCYEEIIVENNISSKEIVRLCLLAGEIMLKSGAETSRVEDTMSRIASSFYIHDSQCYVTPTAIVFGLHREEPAKLVRVEERSTDLVRIAKVNDVSRKISSGELALQEALDSLQEIANADLAYPVYIQILSAALVSSCFLIMFNGGWGDFIPALFAGGIGFGLFIYIHKMIKLRFFAEMVSSFIIGLIAFLSVEIGWGTEMDKIIIGSVMPLVPGLLITNAVRDLMAGHLVSALSKGADAFLTSIAIGTGIAIIFVFY